MQDYREPVLSMRKSLSVGPVPIIQSAMETATEVPSEAQSVSIDSCRDKTTSDQYNWPQCSSTSIRQHMPYLEQSSHLAVSAEKACATKIVRAKPARKSAARVI